MSHGRLESISFVALDGKPNSRLSNAIRDFRCGKLVVDDFLHDGSAALAAEVCSSTTILAIDRDCDAIAGYITLVFSQIKLSGRENRETTSKEKSFISIYGCVKIAMLGVDTHYQHRGLGGYLVLHAIGRAKAIQQFVATRFVTVDAADTHDFYEHYGFELNNSAYERQRSKEMANRQTDTNKVDSMRYDLKKAEIRKVTSS